MNTGTEICPPAEDRENDNGNKFFSLDFLFSLLIELIWKSARISEKSIDFLERPQVMYDLHTSD